MSYGGDVRNEVPDAASTILEDDAPSELNSRPKKRATLKPRISSTNSLHELFQCPVCSNALCPPIIQVSYNLSLLRCIFSVVISLYECFLYTSSLTNNASSKLMMKALLTKEARTQSQI